MSAIGHELKKVTAAGNGDRFAFDGLIEMHGPGLRRFLEKRMPLHEVDDIYQETLVSAWRHIGSFDRRSSFKTWLFSIALNKSRDFARRKGRDTVTLEEAEYSERGFIASEVKMDVQQALAQLCESEREVLDLYYSAEMNLREIAEATGRGLNNVKYEFYRAQKQMALFLGTLS